MCVLCAVMCATVLLAVLVVVFHSWDAMKQAVQVFHTHALTHTDCSNGQLSGEAGIAGRQAGQFGQ